MKRLSTSSAMAHSPYSIIPSNKPSFITTVLPSRISTNCCALMAQCNTPCECLSCLCTTWSTTNKSPCSRAPWCSLRLVEQTTILQCFFTQMIFNSIAPTPTATWRLHRASTIALVLHWQSSRPRSRLARSSNASLRSKLLAHRRGETDSPFAVSTSCDFQSVKRAIKLLVSQRLPPMATTYS